MFKTTEKNSGRWTWNKIRYVATEEAPLLKIYEQVKDTDLLARGNGACLGCGAELIYRFVLRVVGRNCVVAVPPGCMAGVASFGVGFKPSLEVPVVLPLLGNTAAMMSGIKRALIRQGKGDTHVICMAGDGATADIGFGALSGAVERNENIIYVCYDNEGYMNTGVQRSSTTPRGAYTGTTPVGKTASGQALRGKPQERKDVPFVLAMGGASYVATANPAFMVDFEAKLRKAMAVKDGTSYIHVISACPTGWNHGTEKTISISRLATETNLFPLWEANHGRFRLTHRVWRRKPISEYTKHIGKYQHLSADELATLQRQIDDRHKWLRALCTI